MGLYDAWAIGVGVSHGTRRDRLPSVRMEPTEIHSTLNQLRDGEPLDERDAERVFLALLSGGLGEAQIGALLALIQTLAPCAATLAGAARAMRAHVERVPYTPRPGESLIDTCGTGGAPKSFNVSTAAAILAASVAPPPGSGVSRVVVAKHGNRSRTGRGSAEVLEHLGVRVGATPGAQARCLEEAGVCFCFAIHHHPAMRRASAPRRALGFPTIFNALGPLTNPAGANRQLIGVYDDALVEPVARALLALGAARAMVVHANDGLDELTTTAPTRIVHVHDGRLREETIDAADLGLPRTTLDRLRAGGVEHSAAIIVDIVRGSPGPHADMAVLSAGAALVVAGVCESIGDGVALAREAIGDGRAKTTLDRLIEVSRRG